MWQLTLEKRKRILSLKVTSEEVHDDGRILKKLVDSASENNNLKGILVDGMMYDRNNNFRYLSKNHIKPGIKTRSNSKVKSTTNLLTTNLEAKREYEHRWMAETVFSSSAFSCIKRMFGEHVTS